MTNKVIDRRKTGYKLWEYREKSGISVSELCELMGMGKNNCSYYEWANGKHIPSLESMAKMAKIFGCKIDDMVVYK